jgi:hypothetical protein
MGAIVRIERLCAFPELLQKNSYHPLTAQTTEMGNSSPCVPVYQPP